MTYDAWFWGISAFFWITLMSFFSMQEMACISFNRLRLSLAISMGSKHALWIKQMLDNPILLFGTTLIGVNVALVMGSEAMRQLFSTLNINPDYSPIIILPYVLIVGELIPMFAARLHPEHMAKLGIPIVWFLSRLLAPITLFFDFLFQKIRILVFKKPQQKIPLRLQRDELRELLQERKRSYFDKAAHETLVSKVFSLREKPVSTFMTPLNKFLQLSSALSYHHAQAELMKNKADFALVRNKSGGIVGYIQAWDLSGEKQVSIGSISHAATFISEETNAIDLLLHLKKDNAQVALVVDPQGNVSGMLTLEDVVDELIQDMGREPSLIHIEKTVFADETLSQFAKKYQLGLPPTSATTFGELVEELLGHKPSPGDILCFGPLEMTVKEVSIRGAKTLFIETLD